MDNKNSRVIAAVFIDVAKAFDSVNHATLLMKLKKYGFGGNANNIIQDYLFGRRQMIQSGTIKVIFNS